MKAGKYATRSFDKILKGIIKDARKITLAFDLPGIKLNENWRFLQMLLLSVFNLYPPDSYNFICISKYIKI